MLIKRLGRVVHPRALARRLLSILPRGTRHEVLRSLVRVRYELPPGLHFKLAETQEELEAAFKILHDSYVKMGYMMPHSSGLRVTPYHALPTTSTLIAVMDDKVIATVSIIRDSIFGFPLDAIFDTQPLRTYGARLAEISSLAISEEFRGNKGEVLFPLLKFLYEYCINYFGVDYMLIAVNPKMIEFYEALLFFERLADKPVERYSFVNGAPAVGGSLDLRQAFKSFAAHYGRKEPTKNLFQYFTDWKAPELRHPDRELNKISDPVLTPAMLDYFFNQKTAILSSLASAERAKLSLLYNHEKYREVLPRSTEHESFVQMRAEIRFEVECKGRIIIPGGNRVVKMTVKDISSSGLRAVLDGQIRYGAAVKLNVAIGDFDIADLEGWPIWNDGNLYGFRLQNQSDNWVRFVKALMKDLHQEPMSLQAVPLAG